MQSDSENGNDEQELGCASGKSGPACRVCADPRLDRIEADLTRPGLSQRALARKYGIGRMSLNRHLRLHLPKRIKRAAAAAGGGAAAPDVWKKLSELNTLARGVFTRGYNESNLSAAIGALSELRRIVELEARLLGHLAPAPTTNLVSINLSPEHAAGMAEILIQRHRARMIDSTLARGRQDVLSANSEDSDET